MSSSKKIYQNLSDEFYFWSDNIGHEVGVLKVSSNPIIPLEIKVGKTITPDYFKGIHYWLKITEQEKGWVIYAGDSMQQRSRGIQVIPWYQAVNG